MVRSFSARFRIALLLLCAAPAWPQEKWQLVHTPHFLLLTDTGEKQARELGLRFEESRAVFGHLLGASRLQSPAPIQIVVFRSDAGLGPYLPAPKQSADGYFLAGKDRSFLVVSLEGPSPYSSALHGYAHAMLRSNYPRTDAWFDEGLAQFFSTTEVGKKSVDVGVPPPGALELLGRGEWMPLEQLLRTPRKVLATEPHPMDRFQAQAWITVHYLLARKNIDSINQYFDLVKNQNDEMADAAQKAFGMSVEQLQQAIQAYAADTAEKVRHLPPPDPIRGDEFNVQQPDPLDAKTILADLQLHIPAHREEAETILASIVKEDPENAAAYRGLGYSLYLKKQYQEAAEYLERAISIKPGDPQSLWYHSLTLQARYNKDHPSYPTLIEGEMQRAVKVDPDFAEGYRLMAWSRAQQTKYNSAIDAIKMASTLLPSDETILQEMGEIYEGARQWDNAAYVLQHLRTSEDPVIAKAASDELVLLEKRKRGESVPPGKNDNPAEESEAMVAPPSSPPQTVHEDEAAAELPPDTRPSRFIKGTLVSVVCAGNGATLNLNVPGKPRARLMHIQVADRSQAVLVGADAFSCEWKNEKVAVNYKPGAAPGTHSDADGDLVSIEIQ